MTFSQRFSHTIKTLKQALKLKQLRKMLLFFGVFVLITPSYKDYLDYFYDFPVGPDAFLEIIVFVSVLTSSIIYMNFFKDVEIRKLARLALVAFAINNFFNILLVLGFTFGLNKLTFVCL